MIVQVHIHPHDCDKKKPDLSHLPCTRLWPWFYPRQGFCSKLVWKTSSQASMKARLKHGQQINRARVAVIAYLFTGELAKPGDGEIGKLLQGGKDGGHHVLYRI